MMRVLLSIVLSLLAFPAFAQTSPPAATPTPPVRVAIVTSEGQFVIEMDDRAPISVRNFLRYVDRKRLDGIKFYRVAKVQDNFGFVQFGVQGNPKRVLPPIAHEPTSQTGIKHTDMTLSLPRFKPGSAGGDFTIMVGDQPSFDADPSRPGDNLGYAAFAHVVEGRDVVVKIFDAPRSPTATDRGFFKGEIPIAPVTIISARRVVP